MLEELKQSVWQANLDLVKHGLVVMTWGNVSGIDRQSGLVAIKPSGVAYDDLRSEQIVLVDLNGKVVEGQLKPSSDTPTHVELYRAFPKLGGVTHTHSAHATMFAQAGRAIACLGTTHADHFHGEVPITRPLTPAEVEADYEGNTGRVIVERFKGLDPEAVPAVLAVGHGPFSWGKSAADSVKNAVALEEVARMALGTFTLAPQIFPLPFHVMNKHYYRKHGPGATYGQG